MNEENQNAQLAYNSDLPQRISEETISISSTFLLTPQEASLLTSFLPQRYSLQPRGPTNPPGSLSSVEPSLARRGSNVRKIGNRNGEDVYN